MSSSPLQSSNQYGVSSEDIEVQVLNSDHKHTAKGEDGDQKLTAKVENMDQNYEAGTADPDQKRTAKVIDKDQKHTVETEDPDQRHQDDYRDQKHTKEVEGRYQKRIVELEELDQKHTEEVEDLDQKHRSEIEDRDQNHVVEVEDQKHAMKDQNLDQKQKVENTRHKDIYKQLNRLYNLLDNCWWFTGYTLLVIAALALCITLISLFVTYLKQIREAGCRPECTIDQVCVFNNLNFMCVSGRPCHENICEYAGECVSYNYTQTCYCPSGRPGQLCDGWVGDALFLQVPRHRLVTRGQKITEKCIVETSLDDTAQYTWYLNEHAVEPYTVERGYGIIDYHTLQIDSLQDHMKGYHMCKVKTANGTAATTFRFKLIDKCNIEFTERPLTAEVKIRSPFSIYCNTTPYAREYTWFKDGEIINTTDDQQIQVSDHQIYFEWLELDDAGIYRCEIEDQDGCGTYREAKLTILPLKHSDYCGLTYEDEIEKTLIQSRIILGQDAYLGQYPWHVTLVTTIDGRQNQPFCGGTLVTRKFVLTAAHCIDEFYTNFQQPFNVTNLKLLFGSVSCQNAWQDRRYKNYILHRQYNSATYDHDIALLELAKDVDYSEDIRPACIHDMGFITEQFLQYNYISGIIAGCGAYDVYSPEPAEQLQYVSLPYVERDECNRFLAEKLFPYNMTEAMICGGSLIPRMGDFCYADSGGGYLMKTREKRNVLVGIISWTVGQICDHRTYSFFVNVGHLYNWIEDKVQSNQETQTKPLF